MAFRTPAGEIAALLESKVPGPIAVCSEWGLRCGTEGDVDVNLKRLLSKDWDHSQCTKDLWKGTLDGNELI